MHVWRSWINEGTSPKLPRFHNPAVAKAIFPFAGHFPSSRAKARRTNFEAAKKRQDERRRMEEERRRLEAESKNLLDKGPIFEETWADVLIRIKTELEKYKRR